MKASLPIPWLIVALSGGIWLGSHAGGSAAPLSSLPPQQPDIPLVALRVPDIHLTDIRPVTTHRDPFVAPIDEMRPGENVSLQPIIEKNVSQTESMPAATMKTIILHGVVIGHPSYAMIEESGRERVVGLGDIVNGGKIQSITMAGVIVSNGLHLIAKNPS